MIQGLLWVQFCDVLHIWHWYSGVIYSMFGPSQTVKVADILVGYCFVSESCNMAVMVTEIVAIGFDVCKHQSMSIY